MIPFLSLRQDRENIEMVNTTPPEDVTVNLSVAEVGNVEVIRVR